MKKHSKRKYIWLALTLLVLGAANGCSTPDPENASARPWNQPRGWEHGLPTNIMEGR